MVETSNRIAFLKEALQLQTHPEGGYFKEVYRSEGELSDSSLPNDYSGARNYSTSIYFLLTSESFSSFHKINQDETWHFYEGSTIELHTISPDGEHKKIKIGTHLEKGEVYQFTVPGNHWFAARIIQEDSYALVGCTVAPGFDFDDFKLGDQDKLVGLFPQHEVAIRCTYFNRNLISSPNSEVTKRPN